jgi:hypothetical protein
MRASLFYFFGASLGGLYKGSKTLFGETINAAVNVKNSTHCDFQISGDISLDCYDEAYSLNGNQLVLDDVGITGDCAHDALADNKIDLKSIVYDAATDTIRVTVKYSIATVDIDLSKSTSWFV